MWNMTSPLNEDQLDQVSAGGSDYLELLSKFWRDFSAAISETSDCELPKCWMCWMTPWRTTLSPREDGSDPRICQNVEMVHCT